MLPSSHRHTWTHVQPSTEKKWQRRGSDGSQQSKIQAYKRKKANIRESPKKTKRTKNTRAASIKQRRAAQIDHLAELCPSSTRVTLQGSYECISMNGSDCARYGAPQCPRDMQSSVSTLPAASSGTTSTTGSTKGKYTKIGFKSTT